MSPRGNSDSAFETDAQIVAPIDASTAAVDAGMQPPPPVDAGCTLADPPAPAGWTPTDTGGPPGEYVLDCISRLSGSSLSHVDTRIPHNQRYDMTTFGGGSDSGNTACGSYADGTWYYAANAHRFSCGAHVRIVDAARTRCVILEVADVGPHICVEEAGGMPIWDVSPLAASHVFGSSGLGWSDHREVIGAEVTPDNPLGPCDDQLGDPASYLAGWIGGPCSNDSGCHYDGAHCNTDWPGGYCTKTCTTECPDQAGANAYTACANDGSGTTCTARCDFTLFPSTGCRSGYGCFPNGVPETGSIRDVCLPLSCS